MPLAIGESSRNAGLSLCHHVCSLAIATPILHQIPHIAFAMVTYHGDANAADVKDNVM